MLITPDYFFGDLTIAQPAVSTNNIQWFINKYEPKLLVDLLGYSTYKAFMAGIQEDPIPAKWLALLYGSEYTNRYGNLDKWKGLIEAAEGVVLSVYNGEPISIVVGRGNDDYDPTDNADSTIIPPVVVGKKFAFEQRGFGTLRKDEYSVEGNILTLLNNIKFSALDTFFYKSSLEFAAATSDTGQKKSLIANYIYYWYIRDQVTETSGNGEKASDTQNSKSVSSITKQCRAWNSMSDSIKEMSCFLLANQSDYSDYYSYYSRNKCNELFRPINELNI